MANQKTKVKVSKEDFLRFLATVIPSWQMPASKYFSKINTSIKDYLKKKEGICVNSILELDDITELEKILAKMSSAQKYVYARPKQTFYEEGMQRYVAFLKQRKATNHNSNSHVAMSADKILEATEGMMKEVTFFRRQRNRNIRNQCAKRDNYTCKVCGFNFEKVYGERGKHFIEVHHLIPMASYDKEYDVKLDDLVSLCSNCHSMIHLGGELKEPKELEDDIKKNLSKTNGANN